MIEENRWDDDTRTYTEWVDGVKITERPYTNDENAAADARIALSVSTKNSLTILTRAHSALQANRNAITSLENFAAGTGTLTNTQRDNALRDLANQMSRALRQLNALIKLEAKDLSSTEGT